MTEPAQTNQSPDEIQSDIRRTREQIDHTLDAVQDKLSPGQLLQEVIGLIRGNRGSSNGSTGESMQLGSKAGDLLSGLGRTIKDNPVPSALIGLGLIGLVRDGDSHSDKLGTRAKQSSATSSRTSARARTARTSQTLLAAPPTRPARSSTTPASRSATSSTTPARRSSTATSGSATGSRTIRSSSARSGSRSGPRSEPACPAPASKIG